LSYFFFTKNGQYQKRVKKQNESIIYVYILLVYGCRKYEDEPNIKLPSKPTGKPKKKTFKTMNKNEMKWRNNIL
jgi:hypothetical protein